MLNVRGGHEGTRSGSPIGTSPQVSGLPAVIGARVVAMVAWRLLRIASSGHDPLDSFERRAITIVTMVQRQHAVARLYAVQMLCDGGGADTHSEDDYRHWLRDTGYRVLDVFSVADSQAQGVIVATPE